MSLDAILTAAQKGDALGCIRVLGQHIRALEADLAAAEAALEAVDNVKDAFKYSVEWSDVEKASAQADKAIAAWRARRAERGTR